MAVEQRYEMLYGPELQKQIKAKPLAWVPLGILEKHGDHLPWGLDTLKAHGVCRFLAEWLGGVVLPGLYVAGVHSPWDENPEKARQRQADVGDFYLRESTLEMLLRDLISGLSNIGFRMIVLYSGHYEELQRQLLRKIADEAGKEYDVEVIPFTELSFFGVGDHAGKWETSIYMAIGGEVRFEAIKDESKGRKGYWKPDTDPRQADREFGEQALEAILRYFEGVVGRK